MPTSVVPALIDALVQNAVAAVPTGTLVYDGFGVDADPGTNYLMVGVEDPQSNNETYSAEATQEWATVGNLRRDENGYVTCTALAWSGDADQKGARDAAYAIVASVEDMLRANPTQGVPNILFTSYGGRATLAQNQAQTGAIAIVTFRINFRARL